jgi:hypothetical protein
MKGKWINWGNHVKTYEQRRERMGIDRNVIMEWHRRA